MMHTPSPPDPPTPLPRPAPVGDRPPSWRPFGYLLLLPAAVLGLITLVLPTLQVVASSFHSGGLPRSARRFVGIDNYVHLLINDRFWAAAATSLSLALLPLVILLILVPVLGFALDRGGRPTRLAGRIALSFPLAFFSPVALATAWDQPVHALTLPLAVGASLFGSVCGVGLIVALAALRDRGAPMRAKAATAAIAAIAVVAVSLQAFSFTHALRVRGRPFTLGELMFAQVFAYLRTGVGAAAATLLGVLLGAFGILATVIAVRTRLSIKLLPTAGPATGRADGGAAGDGAGGTAGRVLIAVVALLVVAAVTVGTQLPWLRDVLAPDPPPDLPRLVNRFGPWNQFLTWVPPFLGAVVAVGAAFLAALGIGGLRPLGWHSEWLLLPFAPWLFVGVLPLSEAFHRVSIALRLNGTLLGLVPPILLSVPALVVLTLFCRGQSALWASRPDRSALSFLRTVVLPALPLAGAFVCAHTVLGAQSLLWQLLESRPPNATTPALMVSHLAPYMEHLGPGCATPLAVTVPVLLALIAAQIWYLDRIAITAEDDPPMTPQKQ